MSAGFSARREVAVGLGTYALYLAARAMVVNERGRKAGLRNARRVVAAERALRIHVGPRLQRASLSRRRALAAANAAYVTLNVGLTVGWLMLLYKRRDPRFHPLRRAWVIATLGAQPAHLCFPTAPPRALEDFTDTIREAGVDLDSGWVALTYNPVAAMPSIHMAWAQIVSAGIASTSRSPLLRRAAPAYPPAVALIVVATANHFLLDVLAGSLLGRTSLALAGARRAGPAAAILGCAQGK